MLLTTEIVRDVLAHELCQVAQVEHVQHDEEVMSHIRNMHDILMSNNDFVQVNLDVWTGDLHPLQEHLDGIIEICTARKDVDDGQQ